MSTSLENHAAQPPGSGPRTGPLLPALGWRCPRLRLYRAKILENPCHLTCEKGAEPRRLCQTRFAGLAPMRENRCQLLWRHDFELSISAVGRLFVGAPSAELCDVAKAASLHVIIRDLHHQFGSQWFPG